MPSYVWCPPYESVFRVLHDQYLRAIQAVPSGVKAGRSETRSIDEKLGEHLVTLFWRGIVDLDLLASYFDQTDDELAAAVMGFVGHALRNSPGEVAQPVVTRIESLWDWRASVAEAAPDVHVRELQEIGPTFASGKLGEAWALAALERAVDLVGGPALGHLVAERLIEVAATQPVTAVRVFAQMIERPEHEWDYVGWRDEARQLVELAFADGDPKAAENARTIVDFYVARGELDFRDLIRSGSA